MTLESFLSTSVPELPMQVAKRLVEHDTLTEDVAILISSDRHTLSFYETTVNIIKKALENNPVSANDADRIPHIVANWLCNDLYALIKDSITVSRSQQQSQSKTKAGGEDEYHDYASINLMASMERSTVDAFRFSSLLLMLLQGTISSTQAKKILRIMFYEDMESDAATIARQRGWKLIKDEDELETLCQQVVFDSTNKGQLEQYRMGGKNIKKISKFYLGEVMASCGGNAHPELLQKVLDKVLTDAIVK